MSKKENKIKGNIGEGLACQFLEKENYQILERNYTSFRGEIDIIALQNEEIAFIEVKTRCQKFCGTPAESINNIKKKHIYQVAEHYLYLHGLLESKIRFDVIEIFLYDSNSYKISHIKNVILEKPKY